MLRLHGMAYSNYYNIVKAVLIEKELDFEEVLILPNQDEDFLVKSPMGKVPCLETSKGFLTETSVILEYLEDLGTGPSFYPESPYERAQVRELMRYLELYIELPARRLYGGVFFQLPVSDEEKDRVRALLERGFAALRRIASYDPYLHPSGLTYADFYHQYSVSLATLVCRKALNWDVYKEVSEIRHLLELMGERPSIQKVAADQKAAA